MRQSVAYVVARLAVAFVCIYQGVVPKLLFHHATELSLLSAAGLSPENALRALTLIGIAELLFGAFIALSWRARWPLFASVVVMIAALLGLALTAPRALVAAFNPVTLNVTTAALAVIALLLGNDVPSASSCLRAPPPRDA